MNNNWIRFWITGFLSDYWETDDNILLRHQYIHLCPCNTEKGCGLRDDLMQAFANSNNHSQEFIQNLDSKRPFQHIYNAIAWSFHLECTLNKCRYIKTSSNKEATKTLGISSDWELLITKYPSAKAAALNLTVHKLTGSKETKNYLHQYGHDILLADIQLLNKDWKNRVTRNSSPNLPAEFQKGKAAHISTDNSDMSTHLSLH